MGVESNNAFLMQLRVNLATKLTTVKGSTNCHSQG